MVADCQSLIKNNVCPGFGSPKSGDIALWCWFPNFRGDIPFVGAYFYFIPLKDGTDEI